MKYDVFDRSVLNGVRQPILYSFLLDKPPGYKVFCMLEANHYKKTNETVLKTIMYYLEDDDDEEGNFQGQNGNFFYN